MFSLKMQMLKTNTSLYPHSTRGSERRRNRIPPGPMGICRERCDSGARIEVDAPGIYHVLECRATLSRIFTPRREMEILGASVKNRRGTHRNDNVQGAEVVKL
ncbi:MAG: hypothetical protein ABFD66_13660 [Smithella sp.]